MAGTSGSGFRNGHGLVVRNQLRSTLNRPPDPGPFKYALSAAREPRSDHAPIRAESALSSRVSLPLAEPRGSDAPPAGE